MSEQAPESGGGEPPIDQRMTVQVSNASAHVFISYASQDAAVAEKLCRALEAAGLPCWIAPRDVRAGESYAAAIVRAINCCRMLVLVLSKSAIESSHVLREVERASSKKRPVLSIRMDATPLPPDLEYFLSAKQWLDASGGPVEKILPALVESVRDHDSGKSSHEVLGASTAAARLGSRPVHSPARSKSPFPWRMRAIVIALAVAAVGLAYVLTNKLWLSKQIALEQTKTAATSVVSDKSIAVLPFVDLSEKHDQEYFADGMAEEVIDLLAKVPGLRVIGRTSSFQFRGKSLDVRAIGEALRVSYVLEGSVRRSGDQVRVTAQLLSTRDGTHRWSETYDAKFDDVLKVQDTIASNLARTLEVAVGTIAASGGRSESPEAYDLFMQGRQALDTNSKDGCERAVGLFTQVLQLDPTSTRALVSLAETYSALGDEGWMPPKEAFGKARQFALRALQVEPDNAGAHITLAYVHAVYDWDWASAEKEMAVAFRLGQRDAWALITAAQIASAPGQWSRAEQFVREALAQDPLDSRAHIVLGYWIYARQGREAEAEASIRRALQINPNFGSGRYFLAVTVLMQGRLEEALAEAQRELPQDGKYQVSSEALYAMHRRLESDEALKKAIKQNDADWPLSIAKVYAFRGKRDQAMNWLERAYQFRDEDLYFIKGDPQLRSLEGDPRYKAFLRKMNLPD